MPVDRSENGISPTSAPPCSAGPLTQEVSHSPDSSVFAVGGTWKPQQHRLVSELPLGTLMPLTERGSDRPSRARERH